MEESNLQKHFFKVREFAQEIGAHPNTIYQLIKSGYINAFRMGTGKTASYRIPASEIERLAIVNMNEIIDKIVAERTRGE